ncbi:MAG TPA: hypothetical protein VFZ80_05065 [Acidimicrobiia bacterium]
MLAPLVPRAEAGRRAIDRFAAVELPLRRDADDGSRLGDLLVGHVPRRVRLFGEAPAQPSPLLGRWKLEVAHLHRRTEVGCGLP